MKVQQKIPITSNHAIEIGFSTWSDDSYAIRNRYDQANGKIDPRSSSEIPRNDIVLIMRESINNDLLQNDELLFLIEIAAAKLRQNL